MYMYLMVSVVLVFHVLFNINKKTLVLLDCSLPLFHSSGKASDYRGYISPVPCTNTSRWRDVSPVIYYNYCSNLSMQLINNRVLFFIPRVANLYVSMNEGLSFISSSVTITTVACVSIWGHDNIVFFDILVCVLYRYMAEYQFKQCAQCVDVSVTV